MFARIGLIGRIMLILMAALMVVVVAALVIGHYERAAMPALSPTPYPRIEQAAGVIDLIRKAEPSLRPAILRALNGSRLRAVIVAEPPPETDALRRAPRIEATLNAFADGPVADLRAYVDADTPRRPAANLRTEGRPARVVWPMPDGAFLVLDVPEMPRRTILRIFGLPPGFWIGMLGIAVAVLALFGAQREMRPLRRLATEAAAFDGTLPTTPVAPLGPPDIRALIRAVHGMQERVAALLQERSFLIGAISHDLKTYLTRLRLRAEGVTDPDARTRMIGDLDAMTDLIETALAFARGTTVSQQRGRVDLADLIAIEVAERDAVGQPIDLVGEDAADAVVAGDPVALRRVVANLVDNACKFGRSGIEIALEVAVDTCRIRIEDDGSGVSEVERAAIFSPFYRIEGSRSRRTGGSGLGLAIARQIVEAHGGTVAVSGSRLGGACFTVSLPRTARG